MGSKNQADDITKEKIKALLSLGKAKNAVARELSISWATVDKYGKEEPDKLECLREQKKKEFIAAIWQDMEDALQLGRQKINLAKVAIGEFQPTLDKLIDLLESKEDVNGSDVIELIKALSSITSIPLSHISTYFGTLYDKQALMNGEATSRNELIVDDPKEKLISRIDSIVARAGEEKGAPRAH